MRISTAQLFRDSVAQMQQQQLKLSQIQEQIASGLRIQSASDDPAAAAQILNIERSLGDIDRLNDNAGLSHQKLALLDTTLGELNDNLTRVRELAVQANSGTLSAEQLGNIDAEVRQIFDSILQISNRQDGEGLYLFAGNDQASAPPFVQTGNTVSYSGDQGYRQLEIAPGQFIPGNIPGAELFQRIETGTGSYRIREDAANTGNLILKSTQVITPGTWDGTPYTVNFLDASNYEVRDQSNALVGSGSYTPGESIDVQGIRISLEGTPSGGDSLALEPPYKQDIFTSIQNFSDALTADHDLPGANSRLANDIYATLEDLDQAMTHINQQRAKVGSQLNTTENAIQTHDALNLQYRENLSALKDLDYAEASAQLAQQLTALQAAQAAFVRVQGLSLFNLL